MGQGVKIVLTEKQEAWLIKHFKHTKNDEIATKFGIAPTSAIRLARKLGLKKTPQFVAKCQREMAEAAKRSHLINGTYPPKGYQIPGKEKGYFKKGETNRQRLGPKREAERIRKATESREKTRKSERARAVFGLPQRTKLRVIPVPVAKLKLRYYLKKKGYLLDEKERIAYYTEETKRGKRIEAKQQPWYKFRPVENINKTAEM